MRILFLDVNGVLDSREWDSRCALTGADLLQPDPRAVVRLLGILAETDAKVVLTSTWRWDKAMKWPFPIHDVTPRIDAFGPDRDVEGKSVPRSEEIARWIETNDIGLSAEDIVIVDDDPDAGIGFEPRFVQIDPAVGLTPADAARIVGLFT